MNANSEHGLSGDLRNVDSLRIEGVFARAGFSVSRPHGEELAIRADLFEIAVYPATPGASGEGRAIICGVLFCSAEKLPNSVEEIASLLEQSGATYSLGFEVERDQDQSTAVVHPAFGASTVAPHPFDEGYTFDIDNPVEPDSPHGRDRLIVERAGSFLYENQQGTAITKSKGWPRYSGGDGRNCYRARKGEVSQSPQNQTMRQAAHIGQSQRRVRRRKPGDDEPR